MSGHRPWYQIKRKARAGDPLRYAPFWLPKWMRRGQSIWPWKSLGDNLVWIFGPWRVLCLREQDIRGRGVMMTVGVGLHVLFEFRLYPGSLHITIFALVGFDLDIWWL